MFLNDSIYNHSPKVGDVLLFPNYLMHTAYPFQLKVKDVLFLLMLRLIKKLQIFFQNE